MGIRKMPLVSGEYYHLYNCGPNKAEIFSSQRDFGHFLLLLEHCNSIQPIKHLREKIDWSDNARLFIRNRVTDEDTKENTLVTIEAYCVLPNHFHLLVRQNVDNGISTFMARVCGGYSRKYNSVYSTFGTRFQGRFQAKHIDTEEYLHQLLAYIPANYLVHKTNNFKSSITDAFSDNVFITESRILRDNFSSYEKYMSFAIPMINETRKRRGKDELFDE